MERRQIAARGALGRGGYNVLPAAPGAGSRRFMAAVAWRYRQWRARGGAPRPWLHPPCPRPAVLRAAGPAARAPAPGPHAGPRRRRLLGRAPPVVGLVTDSGSEDDGNEERAAPRLPPLVDLSHDGDAVDLTRG